MAKKESTFGERMRRAREEYVISEERYLTQEELAAELGVPPSAVSHWETGKRVPRLSRIQQIAKVLGVSPNDLVGWED